MFNKDNGNPGVPLTSEENLANEQNLLADAMKRADQAVSLNFGKMEKVEQTLRLQMDACNQTIDHVTAALIEVSEKFESFKGHADGVIAEQCKIIALCERALEPPKPEPTPKKPAPKKTTPKKK